MIRNNSVFEKVWFDSVDECSRTIGLQPNQDRHAQKGLQNPSTSSGLNPICPNLTSSTIVTSFL